MSERRFFSEREYLIMPCRSFSRASERSMYERGTRLIKFIAISAEIYRDGVYRDIVQIPRTTSRVHLVFVSKDIA